MMSHPAPPVTSDYLTSEQALMACERQVLRLYAALESWHSSRTVLEALDDNEVSSLIASCAAVAKRSRFECDWPATIQHNADAWRKASMDENRRRRKACATRPVTCGGCGAHQPANRVLEVGDEVVACADCDPFTAKLLRD